MTKHYLIRRSPRYGAQLYLHDSATIRTWVTLDEERAPTKYTFTAKAQLLAREVRGVLVRDPQELDLKLDPDTKPKKRRQTKPQE